jgi:hypothetical protein
MAPLVARSLRCLSVMCVLLGVAACAPEPRQAAPAPKPAPAPPPPAPKPDPPVSANDLPPRNQVTGDGFALTEYVDGRVRIKTTAIWNEAIDTTYDDCSYYRGAVPVLERQLSPERIELLYGLCDLTLPKRLKGKLRAQPAPKQVRPSSAMAKPAAPKATPPTTPAP